MNGPIENNRSNLGVMYYSMWVKVPEFNPQLVIFILPNSLGCLKVNA